MTDDQHKPIIEPEDRSTESWGRMTASRSATASLPLHGPRTGTGTTSTEAEHRETRLDNDLAVRDAIYADGQTPETFNPIRGARSGPDTTDSRSAGELKDALHAMGGETPEQARWRKAGL